MNIISRQVISFIVLCCFNLFVFADDPCNGFVYQFPDGSNIIPCGNAANTTSQVEVNSMDGPTSYPINGSCGMPLIANNENVSWVSLTVQNGAGSWEWQLVGNNLIYEIYYATDVCSPDCETLTYLECGSDFSSWQVQTTPEAVPEIRYYIAIFSSVVVDQTSGEAFVLKYRKACGEGCPDITVTGSTDICLSAGECFPLDYTSTGGTAPYTYYAAYNVVDGNVCGDGNSEPPVPITEICAIESGTYQVVSVDANNCVGFVDVNINVQEPVGTACDDGDPCTINDMELVDCDGNAIGTCTGEVIDCDSGPTSIVACDDGDSCTINDMQTILDCDGSVCVPCTGEATDCSNGSTSVVSCDDGDPCTVNDQQTILDCDGTICEPCMGVFEDADGDGVCDAEDLCMGFDDNLDVDMDGVPDDCDEEFSDLELSKTVNSATANVGDQVVFTITIDNLGPDRGENVTVLDQFPACLSFVSATASTGNYDNLTGLWTIGTMPAGDSYSLMLTAIINCAGSHTNTAQVQSNSSTDNDSSPGNNDATEDDQDSATVEGLQVDLAVTKVSDVSIAGGTANLGDVVTYSIEITNNGPGNATGVSLADTWPTSLLFISDLPSIGNYDNTTGLWTIGNIPAGATETLTLSGETTQVGTVVNLAVVDNVNEPDSQPSNNLDSDEITVVALDLSLQKAVDNSMPNYGTNVTYTLTLTNNGPVDANNIEVTDALPPGLTFVSASDATYDPANGDNTWNIVGPIANGGTATLDIIATVLEASQTIINSATITASDETDTNPNNNSDDATLQAMLIDLEVEKTINATTANVGDLVTYTINVSNLGPSDASGVIIEDALPTSLIYNSSAATNASYDATTGLWNIGIIPVGSTYTLTIIAEVAQAGLITNIAQVNSSDQPDVDSQAGNDIPSEDDQDEATFEGLAVDLAITKVSDISATGATANVGDTVYYTIQVVNNGPSSATNVVVSDFLPASLGLNSWLESQGTYDPSSGTWLVGIIPAQLSATLVFETTVLAAGEIENIATITNVDETDLDPSNNEDNDIITGLAADVSISKTISNTMPLVGEQITYTLELTNNGPNDATGINVTDALPAGVSNIVNISNSGLLSGTQIDWSNLTVTSGSVLSLTFDATITSSETISNTACIESSDVFDPNENNNCDNISVMGIESDLELTKTIDQSLVNVGDQVVYTITVANNGPSDASSVIVNDQLPTGLSYVSNTTLNGTYDSTTGDWNIGNVANGDMLVLTITATVDQAGITNNTAAIINADQPDPDSDVTIDETNDDDTDDEDNVDVEALLADIALTKTHFVVHQGPSLNNIVGDTVYYVIQLINNGPTYSTNIEINDIFPSQLDFVSANPSAGNFDQTTNTWSVDYIDNQATFTLEIAAIIIESGTIENIVTVTSNEVPDPNDTNNTANDVIEALPACPTAFNSFFSDDMICGDETVTYYMQFSPEDAENVIITIDGPNGLQNLNYDNDFTHSVTFDIPNNTCEPMNLAYPVSIYCIQSEQYIDLSAAAITVYPASIEQYVTIEETSPFCGLAFNIDVACQNIISAVGAEEVVVIAGIPETVEMCYQYNTTVDNCFPTEYCESIDVFCPCTPNDPGIMPTALGIACWEQTLLLDAADILIGSTDVVAYMVHNIDQSIIYGWSNSGLFTNDGTYPTGISLYVSAVVGPPGPDGLPSLLSPCTQISTTTTEIRFLSEIIIDSVETCDEMGNYSVDFSITGGHPESDFGNNATYQVFGDYIGDLNINQTYSIGPKPNGSTYYIIVLDDGKGCAAELNGGPVMCAPPCPDTVTANQSNTSICSGESVDLSINTTGFGNYFVQWFDNGEAISSNSTYQIINNNCAPSTHTITMEAVCADDDSEIYFDEFTVIAYPNSLLNFVGVQFDGCAAVLEIDEECQSHISGNSETAMPGETGTWEITANYTSDENCVPSYTFDIPYDCEECPTEVLAAANTNEACNNDQINLASIINGSGAISESWTMNGMPVNPNNFIVSNINCAPEILMFVLNASCIDNSTITYSDTTFVTVYPSTIEPFVSTIENGCMVGLQISPNCNSFISVDTFMPAAGESGTTTLTASYNLNNSCAPNYIANLNYNCISCPIGISAFVSQTEICSGNSVNVNATLSGNGEADLIWTLNGNTIADLNNIELFNTTCEPQDQLISVTANCVDDSNQMLTENLIVTVYPTSVEEFITVQETSCGASIIIDPDCSNYITGSSFEGVEGDSGPFTLIASFNNTYNCATAANYQLTYDCTVEVECPNNVNPIDASLNVCSGEAFNLTNNANNVSTIWSLDGVTIDPNNLSFNNDDCAPSNYTIEMMATCNEDITQTYSSSVNVIVYPTDISTFVSANSNGCVASLQIINGCEDFISIDEYVALPGESGTANLTATYINQCVDPLLIDVDYNCIESNVDCPNSVNVNETNLSVCSGELIQLTNDGSNITTEWLMDGVAIDPSNVIFNNEDCAPITFIIEMNAICNDDANQTYNTSIDVIVYPINIESFVFINEGACTASLNIENGCEDYIVTDSYVASPGETGTAVLTATYINACVSPSEFNVSYNCPSTPIEFNCEDLNICTQPITAYEICFDDCLANSDYAIENIETTFFCSVFQTDEYCFTYTPLPGVLEGSLDTVLVTFCNDLGECTTSTISVEISTCVDEIEVCTDFYEACSEPMQPINICLDCTDAVIDSIQSTWFCTVQNINNNCFEYVPLPMMDLVPQDSVHIWYCQGQNNCDTALLVMTFSECEEEIIEDEEEEVIEEQIEEEIIEEEEEIIEDEIIEEEEEIIEEEVIEDEEEITEEEVEDEIIEDEEEIIEEEALENLTPNVPVFNNNDYNFDLVIEEDTEENVVSDIIATNMNSISQVENIVEIEEIDNIEAHPTNSDAFYLNYNAETAQKEEEIVRQIKLINEFHIYPNPATNFLNIGFESSLSVVLNIKIINNNGQAIVNLNKQVLAGKQNIQLQIETLEKGIYYLQISNNDRLHTMRFIKN